MNTPLARSVWGRFSRFGHAAVAALVMALAGTASGDSAEPAPPVGWVDWPRFGPEADGLSLSGHTNELPDFVGPIDGSARLVVFTEGNHFPVLLPMLLDGFPEWAAGRPGLEPIDAADLLIVTLPQVMVVEALETGSMRLGNATLRPRPGSGVFPHVVMGGGRPMGRLAAAGVVADRGVMFAKHRGLGLLLRRGPADGVDGVATLVESGLAVVFATPGEAGARRQYRQTLTALAGEPSTDALFSREIGDFPGRLGIQHRDVPYALLTGRADAGVIFGHLASFYAEAYPDRLRFVPVEAAAPFGQTILAALTPDRGRGDPLAEALVAFLLERGQEAYPAGGFATPDAFPHGEAVELTGSP